MRTERMITLAVAVGVGISLALVTSPVPGYATPVCDRTADPTVLTPDVPWPQQRYGLERLAGLADGTGVLVAVIDSGIDARHPQLSGAVQAGLDLLDRTGDGRVDCVGHGTAVASIVAGRPRSGAGFRGVAPGATLLPLRVTERMDGDGPNPGRAVPLTGIAEALRFATDHGADVVNLSLTAERDDRALREAVLYARSHDVVVVAAVGNQHERGNPRPYPAGYEGVLGVGAIAADGSRAALSQVGDYVDLVAPGVDVTAADHGGGHSRYTGTSFAAAYVTGAAALVRQYHPDLTATGVVARLTATADPAISGPSSGEYGAGALNPYRSVTGGTGGATDQRSVPVVMSASPDLSVVAAATRANRSRHRATQLVLASCSLGMLILLAGRTLRRLSRSA